MDEFRRSAATLYTIAQINLVGDRLMYNAMESMSDWANAQRRSATARRIVARRWPKFLR